VRRAVPTGNVTTTAGLPPGGTPPGTLTDTESATCWRWRRLDPKARVARHAAFVRHDESRESERLRS
jgi:hypothetical protein